METKKLFKNLKRRLGLITAILAMLLVSQGAFAWGWAARDKDNQDEHPSVYVGGKITFSWCVNNDGNGATFKRVGISTSSTSFGTENDPGYAKCNYCTCEGASTSSDGHHRYQYEYTATSAGTKYYSLWLGWGSKVSDNGRYYNGGGWSEGMTSCSGTSFTVNAVPAPDACAIEITNAVSGTGTSSDPYIVRPSASYTVKLTATTADASLTGYGWNINSTSSKAKSSTTNTYTNDYTAGLAGTSAEYTGYAWHYNGSTSYYSSDYATSNKIYVSVQAACTPPTITASNPAAICGSGKPAMTASTTAGTIHWYSDDACTSELATGDSYTPSTAISTTTKYYLKAIDGGCASDVKTLTATVNTLPTAGISGNDAVCQNGSLTLTGSGGTNYSWNNGGYSDTNTFTVITTSTGQQTITLKVKDGNNCESTETSKDVTVNAIPTAGTISASSATICENGSTELSATGTTTDVTYQWQKSTTSATESFTDIEGAVSETYTASGLTAGNYWFRLVVSKSDCNNTSNVAAVTVIASPNVSASPDNTTAYEVITLTSTSGSVTWSKSDAAAYFVKDNQAVDGDTVDAVSVNFKAPAKNTDYTVTAEGSNGCTSNLNITISEPQETCN